MNQAFEAGKEEEQSQQNIWSSILQQVQSSGSSKLPSNKSVLILGENESGKTSLIAKMQGIDDPKKGSGLEYHHLLVRDEYSDEQTRLGVWVLDGDAYHQNLLKFALNEQSFSDMTVILIASMTTPWDILNSLENWAYVLEKHMQKLILKADKMNYHKSLIRKRFKDYISPGDEIEGLVSSPIKSRTESINSSGPVAENQLLGSPMTDSANELGSDTLPEDVLTHNIGLDVIVVISKTDYMSTLEKEMDFKEEAFDFIQQAVRKFSLKYGASLFYVSAKINKNCDLLYKYLVHRIYGLPFKTPALVVEKDAVFIPSGWDSEKKIRILYENIQSCSPDDRYNDVISKPLSRKPLQKDVATTSLEDQVFLLKMQAQLNQNSSTNGTGTVSSPAGMRTSPATTIQKSYDGRRSSPLPGVPTDGPKSSPGGEGVLQNFFNSLLNRRSGTNINSSPVSMSSNRSTPDPKSRSDVAEELHRMTGGSGSKTTSVKKGLDLATIQSPTPSSD